jgi:UTP--glucose-1-phosphate uridylyltransferase
MKPSIRKAVIPAAGLGTRGLPFTKEVPKELLPIIDTPIIHFIVEEVVASGVEQVILITSREKTALENYFEPSPELERWLRDRGKPELAERVRRIGEMCEIISIRQKHPLGLGHAVSLAQSAVGNEPFAVCLGDEIFPRWDDEGGASALSQLVSAASQLDASIVGTFAIEPEECRTHGVLDLGGIERFPARVLRTVEKPEPAAAPSRFGIVGRYLFRPEIFDALREIPPGRGGEIQLTDGMDRLAQGGKLYALELTGYHYDIGSHLSYVKAQVDAALRRPELAQKLREYLRRL